MSRENMFLKSKNNIIICESRELSYKQALYEAVETGVDICGINLRKVSISQFEFSSISIDKASFWGSELKQGRFVEASMRYIDFRISQFKNVIFDCCDLMGGDFRGVDLSDTTFINCDLSFCKFNDSKIFYHTSLMLQNVEKAQYYSKDGDVFLLSDCEFTRRKVS